MLSSADIEQNTLIVVHWNQDVVLITGYVLNVSEYFVKHFLIMDYTGIIPLIT